jgi:hypothetical protein
MRQHDMTPKTQPTQASIDAYLAARAAPEQLADARALIALLQRVTGEAPKMWGPSIVGFGSYRYPLASGKTGESCATGFAIRGREFVVYLVAAMMLAVAAPASFAQAPAVIDQVAWLAGCWAAQDAEPGSVEHWLAPAAGTMFGVSRTVRGGRLAGFEFMSIRTSSDGRLVFVAQPGGSPPTEFPAVSLATTAVTFENADHDFPNRVSYRQTGPASMLGRIEGTLDGVAKTVDFKFDRVPCPP